MNIDSYAIVTATLLGPVLAVQVQTYLERGRQRRNQQLAVFRTLWTQRLALTAENVRAFNAIPLEFYRDTVIIKSWRAYVAHLNTSSDSSDRKVWGDKRMDLFFDLLQKIAKKVGYQSDFVQLKNDFYWPRVHVDIDTEQETIRKGFAAVFSGVPAIPMDVKNFPGDVELNALLKAWLKQNTR